MRVQKEQKPDSSTIVVIQIVILRSGKTQHVESYQTGHLILANRSRGGESHFGVFASQDIEAKSELFYDYNFSTFNNSVESEQVCHCGSEHCRGTIGRKIPRNAR